MQKVQAEKGRTNDRDCRKCLCWTGHKEPGKICGSINTDCVYINMTGFSFIIRIAYGKCYRNVGFLRFYRISGRIGKKLLAFTDGPLRHLRSKWHNVRGDLKYKAVKMLNGLRKKN